MIIELKNGKERKNYIDLGPYPEGGCCIEGTWNNNITWQEALNKMADKFRKFLFYSSLRIFTLSGISLYDWTFSAARRDGLPTENLRFSWASELRAMFPSSSFLIDNVDDIWTVSSPDSGETGNLASFISKKSSACLGFSDLDLAYFLFKKQKQKLINYV